MRADKRRTTRKPMRYSAWLHVGEVAPRGCIVADISDAGARLDVDAPDDVPEHFVLLLSKSGYPRRRCRTVWRTSTQIGVQFQKGPASEAD